jgi:hypothetical protein
MFFTAQSLQNTLKLYGSLQRLVVLRLLALSFTSPAKAISEATYFMYIDKNRTEGILMKANARLVQAHACTDFSSIHRYFARFYFRLRIFVSQCFARC